MALELKISQKLSQTLVMTPQLQQAIKLLQLGRLEYMEVIEKELLENPVLDNYADEVDRDFSSRNLSDARVSKEASSDDKNFPDNDFSRDDLSQIVDVADSAVSETKRIEEGMASGDSQDFSDVAGDGWDINQSDFLDVYGDSSRWDRVRKTNKEFDDLMPSIEGSISNQEGLDSHLLWQLRSSDLDSFSQQLAANIIGNIDRNGYLACSVEEIALTSGATVEQVELVLSRIQEFDPSGVGARDLRECLLIQLDHMGLSAGLIAKIVSEHLSLLETKKYDAIAKAEKVEVEEVYGAVKIIQSLEPRPGRLFADEMPIYITPDVYVRKVGDEYVVSLNETGLPKLRLNPQYKDMFDVAKSKDPKSHGAASLNGASSSSLSKLNDAKERDYLQDRIRSATWLIRSVHQRQQTILKVTESIMKFQRDFIEQGISALKPLVLRDIAEDVGMHESTVSRVTTNKYVHTPWGVLELKYFFSSGIKSGNTEVSSESVKERIRELVASENPKKPLSDQALVGALKQDGLDIARRTVAKYREMMGILSSSRRKQLF